MKQRLLEELKKEYEAVHGCYRPACGPCFYIASQTAAGDFGRHQGRRFVAAIEDHDGTLRQKVSLTFLVSKMAQLAKGDLIGNLDEFCRKVGLERLREALDRDFKTERDDEIVLTRESDESQFQRPRTATAIRRYQGLKSQIVHFLASRHAQGEKRVLASAVLESLCDDPRLINRALNELVELKLLRDLNHSEGMRLTAAGQKSAEAALISEPIIDTTRAIARPLQFDFFISYASEDREVAEALDKSLSARGYKVWRDQGQLTLGDSLTAKINEGLAASRFGIVVLSGDFLRKEWPKAELNALQARAIAADQKVVLPIRRKLSHDEISKHLPLLGDKLTIAFDGNLDQVVDEIERAVKS